MSRPRNPLVNEREKSHGSFRNNAAIWHRLTAAAPMPANEAQALAIKMIYLKLARILSGQAHFKDHWVDIQGYASLGAEECE